MKMVTMSHAVIYLLLPESPIQVKKISRPQTEQTMCLWTVFTIQTQLFKKYV